LTSLVPDERIYMVYVPEEHQVVENAPMIRINELESYRKDYADDEVQTISVDIQIDLWTKKIEEARVIQSIIDDIMAD
ncbi:hypothetical protein HUN88_21000, partial [Bacillus amyloliquefaciens]|nr:hypothetical protein [Bacillus amyloliquefaciens]